MREYIKRNFWYLLLIIFIIWIEVSNIIQSFKCPEMSQTELFIHIPKSVVCDWKHCE